MVVEENGDDTLRKALRTYYDISDDSRYVQNNFVWVSEERLKELVINAEHPSAGAFIYGNHTGVLLNAESNKDNTEFSAEVAIYAYYIRKLVRFQKFEIGDKVEVFNITGYQLFTIN